MKTIYIITCPKKEVLNKLFFELDEQNNIILNIENKTFFAINKIIDWNEFKIIDRVNVKKKKILFDETKPNILVVNTEYLKTLSNAQSFDYKKCNFISFDECHGISANKFYDLMFTLKFEHKINIIGYSATPVRTGAEDKVKKIFSKSLNIDDMHTLNLISNYDIMQAISDNIV